MSRAVDMLITYRVVKGLVTPFDKTKAYEQGIIDKDGKVLKKRSELKTSQEKNAYTILDRFIFNLKRIMHRVGLKSSLSSYAVALGLLLKETNRMGVSKNFLEGQLFRFLLEHNWIELSHDIENDVTFIGESLKRNYYKVKSTIYDEYGYEKAKKGDDVVVYEDSKPIDTVMGLDIYEVFHTNSKEKISICEGDIKVK